MILHFFRKKLIHLTISMIKMLFTPYQTLYKEVLTLLKLLACCKLLSWISDSKLSCS